MTTTPTQPVRDAFVEALQTHASTGVVPRHVLEAALLSTTAAIATTLYGEICRLQLACDTDNDLATSAPFVVLDGVVKCGDMSSIRRFHCVFVDDGWLIDRVADAIDLPAETRRRKWGAQRSDAALAARNQRQLSTEQTRWSQFLLEARDANRDAYERVRAHLILHPPARTHEWHTLLLEAPTRLQRRDVCFWSALRTSACTLDEKRAVCHRLGELRDVPAVRGLSDRLLREIRDQTVRATARGVAPSCFERVRRRLASLTKRGAAERYGSSTAAPAYPPSA